MYKTVYTVEKGNKNTRADVLLCEMDIEILYRILHYLERLKIAEEVFLTPNAVKQHLKKLYEKTGVPIHDFRALAVWTYENRLVEFIKSYVEEVNALKGGSVKNLPKD